MATLRNAPLFSLPAAPFRPALARLADVSPLWAAAALILGVALLAWSAQLSIPLQPVPITLQSYVLITLAALMGWALGGATVAAYLAAGLLGLPVFSGGRSGAAVLTGASGGFLVGFLFAAVLVGALVERWTKGRVLPLLAALALGHVLLLAMGAGWIAAHRGLQVALEKGLLPLLPGAALKTLAALATIILVERVSGGRAQPPAGR